MKSATPFLKNKIMIGLISISVLLLADSACKKFNLFHPLKKYTGKFKGNREYREQNGPQIITERDTLDVTIEQTANSDTLYWSDRTGVYKMHMTSDGAFDFMGGPAAISSYFLHDAGNFSKSLDSVFIHGYMRTSGAGNFYLYYRLGRIN